MLATGVNKGFKHPCFRNKIPDLRGEWLGAASQGAAMSWTWVLPGRGRKGTRCLDVAATGSAVWGDRLVVEVWGPSKGRRGSSEAVAPWGLLTSKSL